MTDDQKIKQFVNDVYLVKFNRFVDTLLDASPDEDAIAEIAKVARWASMYADELFLERDFEGRLINWKFLRVQDVDLGTILATNTPITLAATYRRIVTDEQRPITLTQDGTPITRFAVTDPSQQTKRGDNWTGDRVTQIGTSLIFSRPFKTTEINGHLIADVLKPLPELTTTSAALIDLVKNAGYYNLLVYGVAKNATLPGIVEGGLSPSFAQKYNEELEKAKTDNQSTAVMDDLVSDDYGYIAGIW